MKDSSVSKSSTSDVVLSSTNKGSKNFLFKNAGDNSIHTSMSKSSESQRNSSFRSNIGSKKVIFQRPSNKADKIHQKINIQKINLKKIVEQPQKSVVEPMNSLKSSKPVLKSPEPPATTDTVKPQHPKPVQRNTLKFKPIRETKHKFMLSQSPKHSEEAGQVKVVAKSSVAQVATTEKAIPKALKKKFIHKPKEIKPIEPTKVVQKEAPKEESQKSIALEVVSVAKNETEEEQKVTLDKPKLTITIPGKDTAEGTQLQNDSVVVQQSLAPEVGTENTANVNKRYNSQYYLHSNNDVFLEDPFKASPSKQTEQPTINVKQKPLLDIGINDLAFSFLNCSEIDS